MTLENFIATWAMYLPFWHRDRFEAQARAMAKHIEETYVEVYVNDDEDEPCVAVALVNPGMIERDGTLLPALELEWRDALRLAEAIVSKAGEVVALLQAEDE